MMLLGLMLVIVSTLCQNNEGNQLIVKSDLMQRIWLWRGSCAGIAKRMTLKTQDQIQYFIFPVQISD